VDILTKAIRKTIGGGDFHALTEELEYLACGKKGNNWEKYLKNIGLYTTGQVKEKLRIRKVSGYYR